MMSLPINLSHVSVSACRQARIVTVYSAYHALTKALSPTRIPLPCNQTLSINRGRLSVLVALVILSFGLLPLIEAPTAGSVGTSFLGTPLRLDITAGTIVMLLVTVLTCAGVDQLVRDHPRVRRGEVRRTFSYLILPAATVIVAAQLLINITDTPLWILGLIVTAVVLWLTILAEYAVVDPEGAVGQPRSAIPHGVDVRAGSAALWVDLEHTRAQFHQRHAHLSGSRQPGLRSIVCHRRAAQPRLHVFVVDRTGDSRRQLGHQLLAQQCLHRRRGAAAGLLRADRVWRDNT